jgi:hypothetical protein
MPVLRCTLILRVLGLLATAAIFPIHAEDWLPVPPEDLKMSREPKAPAAPAVYLYRQVDRDDDGPEILVAEAREGALHLKRELTVNLSYLPVEYYDSLRDFFQTVRTHDEEQMVISPGNAPVQHP